MARADYESGLGMAGSREEPGYALPAPVACLDKFGKARPLGAMKQREHRLNRAGVPFGCRRIRDIWIL